MTALRQYETTIILRPELDETERAAVTDRFKSIVVEEFGGEILKMDEWGRRPLAYKVKKEGFGYFVHSRYHASGNAIAEIERIFRITDPVMKFLTIRLDERAQAAEARALTARAEAAEKAANARDDDDNDNDYDFSDDD